MLSLPGAQGPGSIPGLGTKVSKVTWPDKKKSFLNLEAEARYCWKQYAV